MSIAERLKKIRREIGYSQSELAQKSGLTQQSIQWIETGKSRGGRSLGKIARALNVDEQYLRYGSGEKIDCININIFKDLNGWFINEPELYGKEIIQANTCSKKAIGFVVTNDSMVSNHPYKKNFFIGDIVIADPSMEINMNDFAIAEVKKALIFRQYVEEGGYKYLKPLNPQYPLIKIDMHIKLKAKIVRKITKFP